MANITPIRMHSATYIITQSTKHLILYVALLCVISLSVMICVHIDLYSLFCHAIDKFNAEHNSLNSKITVFADDIPAASDATSLNRVYTRIQVEHHGFLRREILRSLPFLDIKYLGLTYIVMPKPNVMAKLHMYLSHMPQLYNKRIGSDMTYMDPISLVSPSYDYNARIHIATEDLKSAYIRTDKGLDRLSTTILYDDEVVIRLLHILLNCPKFVSKI